MPTSKDILKIARTQLGTAETSDGWTKYGAAYESRKHVSGFSRAAWCDMFVGWCAVQAGLIKEVGDFAYTPSHAQWFAENGRWGQTPKVGAIIFFDWGGSKSRAAIDHVGIVEAVRADGSVVTIEGNTDNAVRRRVRRTGIAGYGYPRYGSAPKPPSKPPNKPSTGKPGEAPAFPGRNLVLSTRGPAVKTWQTQMRRRGWHLDADGIYGMKSRNICVAFQREKDLTPDGIVGPRTWRATWEAPIT
jgi:surface antigen